MTSSSGISFGGLFSGLDTESIISQLMQIERAPIRFLETKKVKNTYEKEGLTEVNNSLLSLKSTLSTFASGILFDNQFNSSNERVLTGSATVGATQDTYQMSVSSLAQTQVRASDKFAAAATPVSDGSNFTITAEGIAFTVNVDSGDTLQLICNKINAAVNGPDNFSAYGTARITTNPADGLQILSIETNEKGVSHQFTYTDGANTPLATLKLSDAFGDDQAAKDTSLTIDGVTLTSHENTFTFTSGYLNGVTINVHDTSLSPVAVTIGINDDDIVSKISDFVTQFNTTTELMNKYTQEETIKNPESDEDYKPGILHGDFDLVDAKSWIRIKTTGYVDAGLADYKTMSTIGIDSEESLGGLVSDQLEFDEQKLRTALSADRDQVVELLEGWADATDTGSISYYLEKQTKVSSVDVLAGNFYRRILYIDDRNEDIDDEIANWEERVAAVEERMRNQFAAMEQALQQLQNQSNYLTAQLSNLLKTTSSTGGNS